MNIDAVKRLNAAEIKSLYTKSMKRDFPQNELRPYSTMKRLLRKNEYGVYRAYSNGEAPYAAENPDEKKLRERRIGFYLKNGAVMTEHYWKAFGVEYNLLALPIEGADITNIDFGSEIHNLYLSSFGRLFAIYAKNKLKHWKK